MSDETITKIADAFARLLRGQLTEVQWCQMRARNARHRSKMPICASNDFLDANDVMCAAFEEVVGRPPALNAATPVSEAQQAADLELINPAWSRAKKMHLTA